MTATDDVRVETDFLGQREIPSGVLWGIHTARAVENFAISGIPLSAHPDLVASLGSVKQAAARTNLELGNLDPTRAAVIDQACEEIRTGRHDHQFVVDVVQGGAGTSTNMNANEVVANRALQILGRPVGDYLFLHPLDHVNRSQSTNDAYPTAVKVALIGAINRLRGAIDELRGAFADKGAEFASIVKIGRTQLQDAVPMTLGQEFAAFAATLAEEDVRLADSITLLGEINLGATAIGTGITADPAYSAAVCRHLRAVTGLDLVTAKNLIEATSDTGVFVQVSGVLKRTAVKVSKICNDLRLLSSGSQSGLMEIALPPRQAGSSIMPGKVNPVIPEVVNEVAFAVVGADVTITMAAEAGQLQLNAFEPIMAHSLLSSIAWMTNGFRTLTINCVSGISANREHLRRMTERGVGAATALTPAIGYAAAADIAKAALHSGQPVRDLVLATGLLAPHEVDEALSMEYLVRTLTAQ